jgi:hypothetical protein
VLVVGLPLWLGIAAAVKLSSRGPVLYRDRRVGLGEQRVRDAEVPHDARRRRGQAGEFEASNEADGPLFKIREDPRVTSVGAVLRRLSLDEIPQLWNVLRGEMSLVGPRPLPLRDYERLERGTASATSCFPGVTGLWQISGRSNLGFDDLVRPRFLLPRELVDLARHLDPRQDRPAWSPAAARTEVERVLVTGAAGFVGGHLRAELASLRAVRGRRARRARSRPRCATWAGRHLAAESRSRSPGRTLRAWRVNVDGTVNVLSRGAGRAAGGRVAVARRARSTGNATRIPTPEDEPVGRSRRTRRARPPRSSLLRSRARQC